MRTSVIGSISAAADRNSRHTGSSGIGPRVRNSSATCLQSDVYTPLQVDSADLALT